MRDKAIFILLAIMFVYGSLGCLYKSFQAEEDIVYLVEDHARHRKLLELLTPSANSSAELESSLKNIDVRTEVITAEHRILTSYLYIVIASGLLLSLVCGKKAFFLKRS